MFSFPQSTSNALALKKQKGDNILISCKFIHILTDASDDARYFFPRIEGKTETNTEEKTSSVHLPVKELP